MLFLCLAVLSSSAISLFMRLSANKTSAKLSMLSVNYLVCALLGAAYAGFDLVRADVSGFSVMVVLGVVAGILYLSGFVFFQWNTSRNGVVLTAIFMKLGLLVPMAVSVALFRELPTWFQIVGFGVALLAIVLLNFRKEGGGRLNWQLIAMLLMCGGSDAMSKVYEVLGPAELSDQFLFYTFAVALVLCILMAVCKKERPGVWEWVFGIAVGIPNFFSAKFLLMALKDVPAVVVFPSFSIATMLITTLVGVVFFKERLQKLQWLALAAIILALLLLNI